MRKSWFILSSNHHFVHTARQSTIMLQQLHNLHLFTWVIMKNYKMLLFSVCWVLFRWGILADWQTCSQIYGNRWAELDYVADWPLSCWISTLKKISSGNLVCFSRPRKTQKIALSLLLAFHEIDVAFPLSLSGLCLHKALRIVASIYSWVDKLFNSLGQHIHFIWFSLLATLLKFWEILSNSPSVWMNQT